MLRERLREIETVERGAIVCVKLRALELMEEWLTIQDVMQWYTLQFCENSIVMKYSKTTMLIYLSTTDQADILTHNEALLYFLQDKARVCGCKVQPNMTTILYDAVKLTIDDVLFKVKTLMRYFHQHPGSKISFYHEKYDDRIELSTILTAIEQDEFVMYYQPKLNVATNTLTGVEALVRWFSPVYGAIAPDKFIGILELYGQISVLGDYVMKKVLTDMTFIQPHVSQPIHVSVNVSLLELTNCYYAEQLQGLLQAFSFSPEQLTLELTETMNPDHFIHLKKVLHAIQSQGIRLSMDDFGKGFNSMYNMIDLNFDEVKLDQSLDVIVKKAPLFIERFIQTIQTCSVNIVAEGIETAEQFEQFKAFGCHEMQGYYIAKPMSAQDLIAVLTEAV